MACGRSRNLSQKLVVKAVCEACNGGWMASLESETIPILGPMVRGDQVHLGIADLAVLAHWAAKVAALLDHHAAGSVILDAGDVDQISRLPTGTAPLGFHMRLGYHADATPTPYDIFLTTHVAGPPGTMALEDAEHSLPNAFSVTLGLGRVAISIVGGPGVANLQRWVTGGEFPLMIWPPTATGIDWPPVGPVLRSRQDLQEFHEGFWVGIIPTSLDPTPSGS